MYQLEYPWLLLLLPLPLLIWWLLPPHRETSASIRLPFFDQVTRAAGVQPTEGSVVPKRTWLQTIAEGLAWCLVVLALARPQFVEPPLEKTEPQRDILLALANAVRQMVAIAVDDRRAAQACPYGHVYVL